jgi:hypothetical protein
MKNIPLSIIIFPLLLLLFSGVCLQYLYTNEISGNKGISNEKLLKLKTELNNSEKERKLFNLVKAQNEAVIHSNDFTVAGISLIINVLWSVIAFTIIHLVFFSLWWKQRYNKAIKTDG